jgi:Leucine-rich repeat (LRR) protein
MENSFIHESKSFCLFCRISLTTNEEKLNGYHETCHSEMSQFKDDMGIWYYLQMVNATEADYETDSNGNIVALDLSNRQLFDVPELPFKYLSELNLSYNRLSSIPEWIFRLENLKIAIFPGNGFSQSLVYDMLRLNECGVNVISTGLKFEQNVLKTINFTYIGRYFGPQRLNFPEEITKHFSEVENVNISHNELKTIPSWVLRLKKLQSLTIAGNYLPISELQKLKKFKKLRTIRMTRNNLTREYNSLLEELEAKGIEITNYNPNYWWE